MSQMSRDEMIGLLMQNFVSMNRGDLDELSDDSAQDVMNIERKKLESFSSLKLQNMVVINCF